METTMTTTHPEQCTQDVAAVRTALDTYAWNIRFKPDYAELVLADAVRLLLPDVEGLSEHVALCCDELRIDEEGYPLTDEGDRADGERVWVPVRERGL